MVFSVLCSKFLSRNIVYFANMGEAYFKIMSTIGLVK